MTKKQIQRVTAWSAAVVVLLALLIWALWANKALELSLYTVHSHNLPREFEGFRIAQVSDLHNNEMGKDNKKLLAMLRSARPDMVVITGDLIDSRTTDIAVALEFASQLVEIAPCYYVTGNHELRLAEYPAFAQDMRELGVTVLEDDTAVMERNGSAISVIGINDPTDVPIDAQLAGQIEEKLQNLVEETEGFRILLSHRPELFDVYVNVGLDLVFSGHAHGGQIRLPFVGGLLAPSQGFFPKYDAGLFTEDHTHMVVSRGIGASVFPLRVNNRPEVVVVELQSLP